MRSRGATLLLSTIALFSLASQKMAAQLSMPLVLDSIRASHHLPALAAAVIVDGRIAETAAVGFRKAGDTTRVTDTDAFHLGSDGKAMTATLLAILVERKKIRWTSTIGQIFPQLRAKMQPPFRDVTLEMLLAHRGGLTAESIPEGMTFAQLCDLPGSPTEQRMAYIEKMLSQAPAAPPGTKFIYSNLGYTIAGAMAEQVMHRSYEELMAELVFRPLGITTAGFGAMNTPGRLDAPWQHVANSKGEFTPIDAGRYGDNPPALAPAGRIHMAIGDWARFVQAHILGDSVGGLVSAATFRKLHTPPFGDDYALGWGITKRPWANGAAWVHSGSNNQNFAVVWVAPARRFAVLVATNAAGPGVDRACDDVAGAVIRGTLR